MNARMRRLASDYEQVKKDFAGHKNIIVTPVGEEPPEQYHVTYFVNGIYLLPDGRIETQGRHEVDITLTAEYPRYKPVCKISTPIWHPNFRDGQICIGDIWGAGESLSDIIVNIGDMIQYKSWNSTSPLSADAAQWAIENKHLFPVGNINLYAADYASAKDNVEIDLFNESSFDETPANNDASDTDAVADGTTSATASATPPVAADKQAIVPAQDENDFEITAEELEGIQFIPTIQKMQTVTHANTVKGNQVNFKTIFEKGLIWGLIGGILGFILQEVLSDPTSSDAILGWMGYHSIYDLAKLDIDKALAILENATRISSAIFSALIACSLGLFMGVGEGIYYGSKDTAIINGLVGAGISLAMGFASGFIAQAMYTAMITDASGEFAAAMIRGLGWAVMGLGVGISVGLIKPEKKRIVFCSIGGTIGGFVGGFLFNFITNAFTISETDTGIVPRAVGIIVMGLLIGLGIGLLEQFAKSAWLKVVRGDFEGKEYLVFEGTTSIGNNSSNSIVLFKDKLVSPHHCDITLQGSQYILTDCGSPMGTIVNGQRVTRHILRQGDAIAVGNSVLVFNTK